MFLLNLFYYFIIIFYYTQYKKYLYFKLLFQNLFIYFILL
jgi:hypothetical protein